MQLPVPRQSLCFSFLDEGVFTVHVRVHVVWVLFGKLLLENAIRLRNWGMRPQIVAEGQVALRLPAPNKCVYLVRPSARCALAGAIRD